MIKLCNKEIKLVELRREVDRNIKYQLKFLERNLMRLSTIYIALKIGINKKLFSKSLGGIRTIKMIEISFLKNKKHTKNINPIVLTKK